MTDKTRVARIRDAVNALDDKDDSHWNADGSAAMRAVEHLFGDSTPTRAEVDAIGRKRDLGNANPSPGVSQSEAKPEEDSTMKAKAHKHETRADQETKALSPDQAALAKGDHIEQHKPTVQEAMAAGTGPNATLDSVGQGSITELAPAVHSTVSDPKRVVQQGDDVIVHGRAIIDGNTEMLGRVLKVNQDGSIAVRVARGNGQTFDVPGKVHNADQGDGSFYWTWPAEGLDDGRSPA